MADPHEKWHAEHDARQADLDEMHRAYEEADQADYVAYMAELDARDQS
jgi:hypothetical protein